MVKKMAVLIVCCCALYLACRPFFQPTLFFVHDYLHVARIAEAVRDLEAGHFPIRWSQAFNFGYGMPLFSFYAPLPSLLGAALVLVGIPLIISFKLVYILVSAVTVCGAYLLGKQVYNRVGGLLVAVLFTLAPYRAVNLFVRGALSESWGMACYPWILLGMILITKKNKWGVPCLSLAVAALALSHNLSFMIFLPFAVVWGVVFILVYPWSNAQEHSPTELLHSYGRGIVSGIARVIASVLLGIGLAAFYLLPAFAEKQYVQVEKLTTSAYFNFHLHFLYLRQFINNYWGYGGSTWGPDDGISFFLGYGLVFGVLCSLLFLGLVLAVVVSRRYRKLHVKWVSGVAIGNNWQWGVVICLLSGVLGGTALLLTTEKTQLIWDQVALLRFVQFPWRFVSVASLFLAISASAISLLPGSRMKGIIVSLLIGVTFWGAWLYFQPEKYLDHDGALYYGDAASITKNLSSVLVDYVPVGLPLDPQPVFSFLPSNLSAVSSEILLDRPQEKIVKMASKGDQTIRLNLAWYPGWQAYIDGRLTAVSHPDGLVTLEIPDGEHLVSLVFTETPLRQVSNLISLFSLSILLGYRVYSEASRIWQKKK